MTPQRAIHDAIRVVKSINPIVGNNATEGTGVGVDRLGFSACEVVFHFGVSGDTLSGTVKMQASLEESVDNSVWTAVAAADQIGTLALIDDAAEDEVVQRAGYIGVKRYVRPLITFTGTHTVGTPIAACVILANPDTAPTANP